MINQILRGMRWFLHFLEKYIDNAISQHIKNKYRKGKLPIVIGPWTGEVGSELQYWIPYLNKLKNENVFSDRRLIVISRGGVEQWYSHITKEYIEIFDTIKSDEYKNLVSDRIGAKQRSIDPKEKILIEKALRSIGVDEYVNLHPQEMWKEILQWLRGFRSLKWLEKRFDFQLFEVGPDKYKNIVDGLDLPTNYFAVKFYSSNLFTQDQATKDSIVDLLKTLTDKYPVVLMSIDSIDDHSPIQFDILKNDKIIYINNILTLSNNLGIQTEIIRRSQGFFGTYGGFSILPVFVNQPSFSFYSIRLSSGVFNNVFHQHESVTTNLYCFFDKSYQVTPIRNLTYIKENIIT